MGKRRFLITLWLTGIFMLVSTQSYAQQNNNFEADGIRYNTIDGGCEVASNDRKYEGNIVIPSVVENDGERYNVISIGDGAFAECSNMTSITIPESVTSIGDGAFVGCYGLTFIAIPKEVTRIGDGAFNGCTQLTSITIPEGVTSIEDNLFYRCFRLTSITIPESVTSIGEYAFYRCTGLTSIIIPESVRSIGKYAFEYCSGLTSITLTEGVTTIGEHAFWECLGLTSITIPKTVTNIGYGAFAGCDNLKEIKVDADNVRYSSQEGVLYDKVWSQISGDYIKTTILKVPGGWTGNFTIPEDITKIGDGAFANCRKLTSVTIPKSVTHIDRYGLSDCDSLTHITIPEGVISIGEKAFASCDNLSSITFSESVTSIGADPFYLCSGLNIILNLPHHVSFKNLYNCFLKFVSLGKSFASVPTGADRWGIPVIAFNAINVPENIQNLFWVNSQPLIAYVPNNNYAGVECLPNQVVADMSNLFVENNMVALPTVAAKKQCTIIYGGGNAEKVEIPEKLAYNLRLSLTPNDISDYAFCNQNKLKELIIPATIEHIGNHILHSSANLETIYSLSPTPPTCEENAFMGVDKLEVTLKVPRGTADAYAAAAGWCDFFDIEEDDFASAITNFSIKNNTQPETIYSLDGRKFSTLQRGVNIVRMHNGQTKKVLVK